ncbi:MAG: pyridoxamine 5'-phosphate oxidase family protein [Rikenellaceae bacterium]
MTQEVGNIVDPRIEKFILKHHVLTLATSHDNKSYCSNMFYTYLPEHKALVFTSSESTLHGQQALLNPDVSASIVVESKVVGILQGAQICGTIKSQSDQSIPEQIKTDMRNSYLKRFPYAIAAELNLWLLEVDFIKFTDNKLGFGKKLIWQK